MFLLKKENNYLFQFAALTRIPGLVHTVMGRNGGASAAPFNGSNVSIGVGDAPEAVTANRKRLRQMTGGIHIYTRQNHGTTIRAIRRDVLSAKTPIQTAPQEADALITDVPGVRLLIQTADCQAVMLVDPEARVAANVHCGWRGNVADIVGRTVACMVAEFDCRPERMVAAIGPSLGPCCAEFVNYEQEIPRSLWPFRVGRHHFDLWAISRHQLHRTGIARENIHAAGICTRCNPHLFFSYRKARQTGRFAALIGWDEICEGQAS